MKPSHNAVMRHSPQIAERGTYGGAIELAVRVGFIAPSDRRGLRGSSDSTATLHIAALAAIPISIDSPVFPA
jgi:hypothetical protein